MTHKFWLGTCFLGAMLTVGGCDKSPHHQTLQVSRNGVVAASLSAQGKRLAVSSVSDTTALWNTQTKRYQFSIQHLSKQPTSIEHISFSGNGHYLLTAAKDTLVLWAAKNGQALRHYQMPAAVRCLQLDESGSLAAVGLNNHNVDLIDLNNGHTLKRFLLADTINTLALSKNGEWLLTGSEDRLAILWDVVRATPVIQLKHRTPVTQVAFSTDASLFITAGSNAIPRLWDRQTGEVLLSLHRKMSLTATAFTQDNQRMALATLPFGILIWQKEDNLWRLKQHWPMPKPSLWRPSQTIVNAMIWPKANAPLMTVDSRGMLSWWSIPH